MSRVAKNPISIPAGTNINISGSEVTVKGTKGTLQLSLHESVSVEQEDGSLKVSPKQESREHWAMAGTFRSLIHNMVTGVSQGFNTLA